MIRAKRITLNYFGEGYDEFYVFDGKDLLKTFGERENKDLIIDLPAPYDVHYSPDWIKKHANEYYIYLEGDIIPSWYVDMEPHLANILDEDGVLKKYYNKATYKSLDDVCEQVFKDTFLPTSTYLEYDVCTGSVEIYGYEGGPDSEETSTEISFDELNKYYNYLIM